MGVLGQQDLTSGIENVRRFGPRVPSNIAPNGQVVGDLWYDISVLTLKAWNGSAWVGVASGNAPILDAGLELYQNSSTPFIDFHRAANPAGDSNADFSVRLILGGASRMDMQTAADGLVYSFSGAYAGHKFWRWIRMQTAGEGLFHESYGTGFEFDSFPHTYADTHFRAANSRMGNWVSDGNYGGFGHRNYGPADGTAFGFMQGSGGQVYIGANTNLNLRINGNDRFNYQDDRLYLNYQNGQNICALIIDRTSASAWGHCLRLATQSGGTDGPKISFWSAPLAKTYSLGVINGGLPKFAIMENGGDGNIGSTEGGHLHTIFGNEVRWPAAGLPNLTGNTAIIATGSWQLGYLASSSRYKENIVDASHGFDNPVFSLRTVRFNWKESKVADAVVVNERSPEGVMGIIAEEAAEIASDLAIWGNDDPGTDDDERWITGINNDRLIAYLVDAVQCLKSEIELLRSVKNGS